MNRGGRVDSGGSGVVGRVAWLARGLCTLIVSVGITGCSAEKKGIATYPVTGKIEFKGQPTEGAYVVLHPATPLPDVPRPTAQVKPDGTFELTTFQPKDGAPAGEYKVTVEWWKLVKEGTEVKPGPNVIPTKYTNPQTTPIQVTVREGDNAIDPIKIVR